MPLDTALKVAGHHIVPIHVIAPGVGLDEIHEVIRLTERENSDAVSTTDGGLRFEYACTQLDVILAVAKECSIRAWDVVAFVAQQASQSSPCWTRRRRRSPRSTHSPTTTVWTSARSMASRTSRQASHRRLVSRGAGC